METEIKSFEGDAAETALLDMIQSPKPDLVNLQMILATSSMNHEYARKEYEKTCSYAKKQELLLRMSNYKDLYFAARTKLITHHPDRLEAIERELVYQKQAVLSENGLH